MHTYTRICATLKLQRAPRSITPTSASIHHRFQTRCFSVYTPARQHPRVPCFLATAWEKNIDNNNFPSQYTASRIIEKTFRGYYTRDELMGPYDYKPITHDASKKKLELFDETTGSYFKFNIDPYLLPDDDSWHDLIEKEYETRMYNDARYIAKGPHFGWRYWICLIPLEVK